MIRGLYIGASGMLMELRRTDVISNNLANVATNGFKRDEMVEESFPSMLLKRFNDVPGPAGLPSGIPPTVGSLGLGVVANETVTDWAAGVLTDTGNPLDLGLSGDGLFSVQTAAGVRYTRDGAFTRNVQGQPVTEGGNPVLGLRGPIQLGTGEVKVASDGTVSVNGQVVDRLQLVRFPRGTALTKEGDNLFAASGGGQPVDATTEVHQGQIERSNVNTVREMVALISSMRSYETNQKLIQVQDELMQKAANEVGKV